MKIKYTEVAPDRRAEWICCFFLLEESTLEEFLMILYHTLHTTVVFFKVRESSRFGPTTANPLIIS